MEMIEFTSVQKVDFYLEKSCEIIKSFILNFCQINYYARQVRNQFLEARKDVRLPLFPLFIIQSPLNEGNVQNSMFNFYPNDWRQSS